MTWGGGQGMDDRQLLWKLYRENRKQARHHETLRATGSTLITAGAAALLAALTQQKVGNADLPLAIFIMIIGVFGIIFSWKEYELVRLHVDRSDKFLELLNKSDTTYDLLTVKKAADKAHSWRFPILYRLRLNFLWLLLHFLTFVLGFVYTAVILEVHGISWDAIKALLNLR
jgi:hypothetical protein